MVRHRILVADDDARWKGELIAETESDLVFVDNLSDAMGMIDGRRRWTGAILDRYLLEGDVPFSLSSLVSEAGFIVGLAFIKKFPQGKVCICSGDINVALFPKHLHKLLESQDFKYIYKGAGRAARLATSFIEGRSNSRHHFSEIYDYLLLQPNFFGLGINLEKIISKLYSHARRKKDS